LSRLHTCKVLSDRVGIGGPQPQSPVAASEGFLAPTPNTIDAQTLVVGNDLCLPMDTASNLTRGRRAGVARDGTFWSHTGA
jgi:hypothetical protein